MTFILFPITEIMWLSCYYVSSVAYHLTCYYLALAKVITRLMIITLRDFINGYPVIYSDLVSPVLFYLAFMSPARHSH